MSLFCLFQGNVGINETETTELTRTPKKPNTVKAESERHAKHENNHNVPDSGFFLFLVAVLLASSAALTEETHTEGQGMNKEKQASGQRVRARAFSALPGVN
jgi:hypothetical protein